MQFKKMLMALCVSVTISTPLFAQDLDSAIPRLVQNGAVLAVSEKGKVLYSYQADKLFMPASTLKVPTALAALKILGPDFRFKTDFSTDSANNLYVKGYGDPFLVSEEFPLIVAALKSKGLKNVQNIILDTSYFDPNIKIDGLVGSLNPYDAYNGALLANFNTINIIKTSSGEIRSAEAQTPVTEITRQLASNAPVGKSRINVATHREEAPLYVGYLLKAFLADQGINVSGNIQQGSAANSKALLTYQSSKTLTDILKPALEFSQNLIMNQIFLTMGAEKLGAPATVEKGRKVYLDFLSNEVGLKNYNCEEGSGISRKNQINALEMDKVLVRFFPYHDLLPIKNGMWVKTGTLTGVATLVGYFQSPQNGWVRFVILLNQASNNRDQVAALLKNAL